jgi:hypothetical protein
VFGGENKVIQKLGMSGHNMLVLIEKDDLKIAK